jgi:lipid II:glycine glycyltransferase (peptidoglycan interpeptide bridge formation enzyme)
VSRLEVEVRPLADLDPTTGLGAAWEALVQASPESGFMQSLHWAAFKRRLGYRVLHLGLFDGERLAGGMLAYAPPPGAGVGLLAAPDGPLVPWADATLAREGLRALLAATEAAAPRLGAGSVQIEPRLPRPRPPLLRNFRRAAVDLLPCETLYLDLTPSPAALLAAMQPKGRYNTGLAARRGVTVRAGRDPAEVAAFYPLLAAAGARDDFAVEPPAFFNALAETLCPVGLAQFLIAEAAGESLAAMLLITYGDRATYLYGGVANTGRPLMAGYALQWAAITAGQAAGCRVYDFYGYDATGDPDHPYANFSRFKRQFGGTPVRFIGAQSYSFSDALADLVIRAAREIYAPAPGVRARATRATVMKGNAMGDKR